MKGRESVGLGVESRAVVEAREVSGVPNMLRPYFLTLWPRGCVLVDGVYQLSSKAREYGIVRCKIFGWVDASLESVMTRSVLCLGLDIVFWE